MALFRVDIDVSIAHDADRCWCRPVDRWFGVPSLLLLDGWLALILSHRRMDWASLSERDLS